MEPTDNTQQVATTQIRALLKRRPHHEAVPICVFDAGYDAVQLAQLLEDLPIGVLVRLKSNRCFYATPDTEPTGGHPHWSLGILAFVTLLPRSWRESAA